MNFTKEKTEKTHKAMTGFEYKNKLAAPRLVKVVISSATGSGLKKDKGKNEVVMDRLTKITGQRPTVRQAKKSVASFKVREGDKIGVSVTLRGARMMHFLDKLIHIALPRTKDFRGIDPKAVDAVGNVTIGIKEHTIFPETSDEDLKDVFGLAITIVSTAKNRDEALAFFQYLGMPFKKG